MRSSLKMAPPTSIRRVSGRCTMNLVFPQPRQIPSFFDWIQSGEWRRGVDSTMPMLPELANEVIQLVVDPEVSVTQIRAIVTKDPVLATRVIRLANSAASAPAGEISSIGDAVLRVGTKAVRNVVFTVCLSSRLKDPRIYGRHGRALIDHSIGTAYVARLLADHVGEPSDEAFICGLLHDIGKLLVWKLTYEYGNCYGTVPCDEEVATIVEQHHTEFGDHLFRQWQLPERLREPVVCHHQPGRAERWARAAAVVYVANRLAHRYGFGCAREAFEPLGDPMCLAIGLDETWLGEVDAHAPGLFEVARQLLR